jgi:UDP-glucose 4-epimerase
MLQDVCKAHGLKFAILRYFNVAGADPQGRLGQSGSQATHLIKLAAQAAIGLRPYLEVFGTDYPTKDGTCIRDYIQVSGLADAHVLALNYLRNGGENLICNCGYGHGCSVFDVVAAMKKAAGIDFAVRISPRRPGDSASLIAGTERIRSILGWTPKWDDLTEIVSQALDWEKCSQRRLDPRYSASTLVLERNAS